MNKPIKPKKSLGQNFLINKNIINRIIKASNLNKNETIVEIGPGRGSLTKELIKHSKNVIAIEKDNILAKELKDTFQSKNLIVINADILEFPFEELPKKFKLIGNVPYNISTPIIKKAIIHREQFDSFFLMLQDEYAQRLTAKVSSKKYGSLTCFVQFYVNIKKLFKVSNQAFYPVPKVQSQFLQLDIPKIAKFKANESLLFQITRCAFNQRRKILINSLSQMFDKDKLLIILDDLGIAKNIRAENLSLDKFIELCGKLEK